MNMTPTTDQWMGILRQLIPGLGGIAVALGWITAEHLNTLVADILAVVGPTLTLVGFVWSLKANNATSIQKAAAKPENKS